MTTQRTLSAKDQPFVLPMVPPNLTGDLHLGHALMACVQDCLVRFHHIQGEETAYVPGVDHAGIGMYALVKANQDFQPELPLEARLREWANHYRKVIPEQFRSLNLACDWEREVYTMDARYIKLVHYAFRRLAEGGLLYRGYKVVHWCPNCQTTLSDMECERVTRNAEVAVMGVRVGKRTELIETSQPELLWSASALAVPQAFGVEAVPSPFEESRPLPVVQWGRPGSKACFVIPAHHAEHLALAQHLGLAIKETLDGQGRSLIPPAEGMARQEFRKWTIARLAMRTIIRPVEALLCSRCNTELIGRLSWQWFLHMRPLAQPLEEAIRSGTVVIIPDAQKRQALDWLNRVEDWCISRQISWGQRIPARICPSCAGWTLDQRSGCPKCGSTMQDEQDVFDTWFSSALWPLATAGWPDENEMLRLYPASVLTTGKDILFFYLIRVQVLSRYLTGTFPAPVSYLHGLVLDEHGVKMSKSRGNTITLSQGVERYGADILRATLLSGCRSSYDIQFRDDLASAQQKVAEMLKRLEMLALDGLNPQPDTLDHRLLASVLETESHFARAIHQYRFSSAIETLRAFALEPLARFVSIREREKTGEAERWQGLWVPLLSYVARLFTPVMPTIAHRMEVLSSTHHSAVVMEASRSAASGALLAALQELERLRGVLGVNTYTTISIALPPSMTYHLSERWVKYGSRLRFQIGEAPPPAISWRVPEQKDVVLYFPVRYAGGLRKEAQRLLRQTAERRRLLTKHVEEALADTPRAQQALPVLQSALHLIFAREEVLKGNLAACEQSQSIGRASS